MKLIRLKNLGKQLLICLAIGFGLALLTGLYGHTVLRQHCSEDNSVVDCSLEGIERGLPLAFVTPNLPHDQFKLMALLDDTLIWSLLPAIFILRPGRRARRG